jgi:hypothetical protein
MLMSRDDGVTFYLLFATSVMTIDVTTNCAKHVFKLATVAKIFVIIDG